jgi:hypothetical protein
MRIGQHSILLQNQLLIYLNSFKKKCNLQIRVKFNRKALIIEGTV